MPAGVPPPGALAVTVAVNVTAWLTADGLAEEASVVVVAALLTTWLTAVEVLWREVAVAAEDRGDRVGPHAQRAGGEAGHAVDVERAARQDGRAVLEGDSCRRRAAAGALAVTVAVKVTDWPKTDGLTDEVSVVVVAAWLTVWVRAVEVLLVKLASPL